MRIGFVKTAVANALLALGVLISISVPAVSSPDRQTACREYVTKKWNKLCKTMELQFKRKILDELRSCGITVSETALEPFFSSATCNSIIDNAVVAKNMVAVVKNLEELMQGGDVGKARRYYGMYVVLVKLQFRCHQGFVNECDTAWIPKVDALVQKIEHDYGVADKGASDSKYTVSQRKIYENNRKMNEKALRATRIYRESLERQRDAVAAKMRDAERMYEVALNTYETIGNAVALLETLRYGAEAFEAVMELDFPDLAAFNDAELVAEFQGITDRIKTNR